MARPGLTKHRKFVHLARLLGSQIVAMGVLELTWQRAYEHGPELGGRLDVEFGVGWDGEPGRLAEALIEAGFLDEHDDGSVSVHDLLHHAPQYVKRRFAKEAEREERGETLHDARSRAGKEGANRRWNDGKRIANGKQVLSKGWQVDSTPAPAPKDQKQDQDPALRADQPVDEGAKPPAPLTLHKRQPEPNDGRVIAALVASLLGANGYASEADLKEDVKCHCANMGIAYDADHVRRALDAGRAMAQRGPRRASGFTRIGS